MRTGWQTARARIIVRMSQLNSAVHESLDGVVASKVQQEAQAVARGEMSETDTSSRTFFASKRIGLDSDSSKQRAQAVQRALVELPEADRLPFLAWVEQRYRAQGDLMMLRAIRAYRQELESQTSTQPPESA